jgi:hypothetical protein
VLPPAAASTKNIQLSAQFYNLVQNTNLMNKIICILVSLLLLSGASFGQNTPTKKKKSKTEKNEATKANDATSPDYKKADAGKQTGEPRKADPKLKKGATPEKRYKEHKESKKNKGTAVKDPKSVKDDTKDRGHKKGSNEAKAEKR